MRSFGLRLPSVRPTASRYIRRPRAAGGPSGAGASSRPCFQPLEPRRLLSATSAEIAAALDLAEGTIVTFEGHNDAIGVYENYTLHGILGMPTGPDGDFLVVSTGNAFDAVRTTDNNSKAETTRVRDLGDPGVDDDYVSISFSIAVPDALYGQRLLMDFVYASDMDTDGGDFFDITVNGVNIAASDGGRIEAGGQYVTNERDPDIADNVAGYAIEIGTEYSDVLSAAYAVPDGVTTLDIVITIRDSEDAEQDAWAMIDNIRFEQTQVVYLDFDGENIGDFFLSGTEYIVPDFDANDFGLGGDYASVIQSDLEALFADFDIVFVTTPPAEGEYMHVVVGGSNRDEVTIADRNETEWITRELGEEARFEELYNFVNFRNKNGDTPVYGLADQLDIGNEVRDDMAVVFAEQISSDGYEYSDLRDSIAHYIARNLGLRPESGVNFQSLMAESIDFRGGTFQDQGNLLISDDWGDVELFGQLQNAHQMLLDVLGSASGDVAIRNSWNDVRDLNTAHWTISNPAKGTLYDAQFIVIGARDARTITTVVDEWEDDQVIATDYAGRDPQIVITAAGRNGGEHDYETVGPRNLGQYTAVTPDAQFTSISLWERLGGGLERFQGTSFLFQTQAADLEVYYTTFEYTDVDGDIVKIQLKSDSGLFTVTESDHGPVIALAETSANKDSLKISVSRKSGGDGTAVIGGILGTAVSKLTVDDVALDGGAGIDLVHVGKGKFGAIGGGSDVNIRMGEKQSGDYQFESITGDSHLVFGQITKKFKVDGNFTAGSVVFANLDSFDAKEGMDVDWLFAREAKGAKIKITGDVTGGHWSIWGDVEDEDEALGTWDVKGSVGGGFSFDASGRVGKVKIKGDFDGDIEWLAAKSVQVDGDIAGSMRLTDDGEFFNDSLSKFTVKEAARGFLFQAANDVDKIQLGGAYDSNFYIGFEDDITSGVPIDTGDIENPSAEVKDLKIKGVSDEAWDVENSVFSAPEFGKVALGLVNGNNGGMPFGISAQEMKQIEYDTGTGKVKSKNELVFFDNDTSDDFLLGQIR